MKVEWEPEAIQTLHRYMHDQLGMRDIGAAVRKLAHDPTPPEAYPWGKEGDYRLRVGPYRVMYRLGNDVIAIGHISRVTD
ncbi:type II toxin-antitoxin system RelE/ParE family toxin [Actinomadura sp. 1N219]|uniref:type II toxin-antitoxin system RelE/ParE family toxin n=1 Tax=Actinomadura sp. 1N219 TaxID=3375152 RepID=UPI0037A23D45